MRLFQRNSEVHSLLEMPSGCPVQVEELVGSPSVCSRLCSMGILPGTEMEIRQNCNGNVCVRVRQSVLVLGEGVAKAVRCRKASGRCRGRRRRQRGLGIEGCCHANAGMRCSAESAEASGFVHYGDKTTETKGDIDV